MHSNTDSEHCLFCKIISGEIPSRRVYEDDQVMAFLDAFPTRPGHTLVVPKGHVETMMDASDACLTSWIRAVQRVAIAVQSATGAQGINLLQNNGSAAGQVIHHLHMHIIPRMMDDGLKMWPGSPINAQEGDVLAEKLRKAVSA